MWALEYRGDVLVSGSTDRTVRVWSLEQGKQTHIFWGHTSTVVSHPPRRLLFFPEERRLTTMLFFCLLSSVASRSSSPSGSPTASSCPPTPSLLPARATARSASGVSPPRANPNTGPPHPTSTLTSPSHPRRTPSTTIVLKAIRTPCGRSRRMGGIAFRGVMIVLFGCGTSSRGLVCTF